LTDNFNIYDLNRETGDYNILKEGDEDQPKFDYVYPSDEIKSLVKNE
jgi:hypothetical protein